MGNKKLGLLLIISFTYLNIFAASSPIRKDSGLSSDSLKDIDLGDRATTGMAQHGKIAHTIGFGAHTGGSTGSGEHRTNSGTRSTYGQGGAESNHHPKTHHGASSCNQNCVGLLTFIMTAVASLAHLYMGLQK